MDFRSVDQSGRSPEELMLVFVIRLWVSPEVAEGRPRRWWGVISRLPQGQRYPVRTLKQIDDFLLSHLRQYRANNRQVAWYFRARRD